MTKDEALKLALAFIGDVNRGEWAGSVWRRTETVTAIKEVLAQPDHIGDATELVAKEVSLSKREWVNLTNDQMTECIKFEVQDYWRIYGRAIEAKLKEKNT